jgi:tRNA(Phe) wybutosine-synthesizing methylase Tyw3
VNLINSNPTLFTTSCCSGRVAITLQPGASEVQKEGLEWVFMSHDPIDDIDAVIRTIIEHVNKNMEDSGSILLFKFEGKFILANKLFLM